MVNTIIALTPFTENNGTFCIYPFSHKAGIHRQEVINNWSIYKNKLTPHKIICNPGDAIIWHGGCWHNHSECKNGDRINLNISYYPEWWAWQNENSHEPIYPDIFENLHDKLKPLLKHKIGENREDIYTHRRSSS